MRRRTALLLLLAAGSAPAGAQAPRAAPAALDEDRQRLAGFVGSWSIHMTFWPQPNAAPQESDGTAVIRWVLDGRYIEQRQDCPMMGRPASGIGYTGFDDIAREYVAVWMDDLDASMLQTRGTFDPAKRAIMTRGVVADAPTHALLRYEDATTVVDHDKFIYEAWTSGPARAKRHLVMRIVYRRRTSDARTL
jgi:hypothetical protein